MNRILVLAIFLATSTCLLQYNSTITLPSRMSTAVSAGQAHLTIIAPLTTYSDYQVLLYNLTTNNFITLGQPLDTGDW